MVPRSTKERVFNFAVLFIGMTLGTSLIATITSMVTVPDSFGVYSQRFQNASDVPLTVRCEPISFLGNQEQIRAKLKEKPTEVRYLD